MLTLSEELELLEKKKAKWGKLCTLFPMSFMLIAPAVLTKITVFGLPLVAFLMLILMIIYFIIDFIESRFISLYSQKYKEIRNKDHQDRLDKLIEEFYTKKRAVRIMGNTVGEAP